MIYRFGNLVTVEDHVITIFERAKKLASTNLSLIIKGEEGTGKQLLAQTIHRYSSRGSGPFVRVDARAFSSGKFQPGKFEQYLFGTVGRSGKLHQADGGTLFIKGIEHLPIGLQETLAEILKRRCAASDENEAGLDVRLIVSTQTDLKSMAANDQFSTRLFEFFSGFITLPALRERPRDILTLAVYFIKEFNNRHQITVEKISIAALEGLEKLDWKKNIKQLKNVIRKAIILANADIGTIWIEHIPVPLKLKKKLEYPRADLKDFTPKPYLTRIISAAQARRCHLVPLQVKGRELTVAMSDPSDFQLIKKIESHTQLTVKAVMAESSEIEKAQEILYGQSMNFEQLVKQGVPAAITDEITVLPPQVEVQVQGDENPEEMAGQAPVINLVNQIIARGIHERASDIHLEPCENALRVRYRVDGIMYHSMDYPPELSQAVISRIKVIANMDIARKRQPQDGRIELAIVNREIDLRVATIPTYYGETVVMRVLDKGKGLKNLDEIGLSEQNLVKMRSLVRKPFGMILVTGPTGSGKTSTLYAGLQEVNTMEKKIITVEDPIEYQINLVNQVQINSRTGLTFANGLRSILRLDPDIIMLGEIRDRETAELAVRAALTGHLVFSTLHTNDAPGAITRLIDMGIEPFLLNSAVSAVVAQRLIRLICSHCREEYRPPRELIEALGIDSDTVFYRGRGCDKCRHSGYLGRTAIHEVMVVDQRIRELALRRASDDEIREAAAQSGMESLKESGIRKVKQGLTTIEEVLSVTEGVSSSTESIGEKQPGQSFSETTAESLPNTPSEDSSADGGERRRIEIPAGSIPGFTSGKVIAFPFT